ncbi:ecdysoneless cell cycle regulator [Rhynchophorus ferrugineus]|uniref:Uncharacterized protein n=1 Tax=Rhynchophorus ferrugineus TaxID=354439 RepID=A0A834HPA6_RHYFE|nr:hypothetical protein GWI33_020556 [Rhynchophorus ferrugineus]
MDNLNKVLQSVREDDFVEYYIFPHIESNDEEQQERVLSALLEKANRIAEKYTKSYLWHKDEFKLVVRTTSSNYLTHIDGKEENLPPHLYGVSHYGDNIQDEWFIVFILYEITKEISDTIAKVYDVDGEFLLIEAADFLPKWANPDLCNNRVYIHEGNLHLLTPKDLDNPNISVEEALQNIHLHPASTVASVDIQNSLKNKLAIFPVSLMDNFHHATVFVPTAVAALLKESPKFISAAVQAFCNRDSIDMKACRAMKYFPPEQRVATRIKFTKCLYAMLSHSKYIPDRKIGWNLPPVSSKDYKQHLLGVKVACGMEILVAQAKPSKDIEGDRAWDQYLKILKEKGYFQGLLEGSKDFNNLLNKAKEYYIEHRDSMHYSPPIGQEILLQLRKSDISYEQLQKDAQNLLPDDDESWLDICPEDLDKMLQERYGQKKVFKVDESTEPGTFAQKVNTFLNHVSEVEGAEFPVEDGSDKPIRPPRSKKDSKKGVSFSSDTVNSENQNKVTFDPNSFASAIQNILNFVIPEDDSWDLDSDSDMSEYENDDFIKDSNLNGEGAKDVKNKMEAYMEQMDKELAGTTIGQSFEKKCTLKDSSFEDVENFNPVDIDVNALKNILESYKSQLGDSGPSSNMLGPMGIHLEPKK